jgi:DNA-binding protein HU-beta
MASVWQYGTYGVPQAAWETKRDSCGTRSARLRRGEEMARVLDEFEIRARAVLERRNPELLPPLLALRAEVQRKAVEEWPKSGSPSAKVVNARNQRMLDRAADLLGPENFQEIFGFPASQRINLVDDVAVDGRPQTPRLPHPATLPRPGAEGTVTLKHLAANLSESHEMSKKQTEALLGELVDLVTKHLKKGDRIRIGGLGVLQVRKRAARMGRNPATGRPIQIKASKKISFRPAKELKRG